jgi:hypothetical protein
MNTKNALPVYDYPTLLTSRLLIPVKYLHTSPGVLQTPTFLTNLAGLPMTDTISKKEHSEIATRLFSHYACEEYDDSKSIFIDYYRSYLSPYGNSNTNFDERRLVSMECSRMRPYHLDITGVNWL